jgi:hypothetical protein
MSRASWVLAGVLASTTGCPSTPGEEDDETTQGSTSAPASSSDAESGSSTAGVDATAGDTGPSGPCPLEGMFVDCDAGGVEGIAYCDEIDGELQWGPCLASVDCELGESLGGCQSCTLVEGVPTVEGSATCECEGPADAPECEQTECLQRWDYSCGSCKNFTRGDCFSYDQGCSNPRLGCIPEELICSRVWAQDGGFSGTLTELEDEEAAICLLTSLRDGTPGIYEVLWGYMDDGGWVNEWVYIQGDGTVVVEWQVDCPGCFGFGSVGRSGMLERQAPEWFDDCLADPTAENLIACTVGLVEFVPGDPPPEGYVPPFVTGDCVSLDAACPP